MDIDFADGHRADLGNRIGFSCRVRGIAEHPRGCVHERLCWGIGRTVPSLHVAVTIPTCAQPRFYVDPQRPMIDRLGISREYARQLEDMSGSGREALGI